MEVKVKYENQRREGGREREYHLPAPLPNILFGDEAAPKTGAAPNPAADPKEGAAPKALPPAPNAGADPKPVDDAADADGPLGDDRPAPPKTP